MSFETPAGRQIHFGVREHAMGSTMVGMAAHGGVLPAGGTFFVFLDYMRPPVRLASITGTKVFFVFTHDSVGVGEDGPTHQPVEQLATLRAIPQLQVIRPADANETVAALAAPPSTTTARPRSCSAARTSPCAPTARPSSAAPAWWCAEDDPQIVLVGTGSEVAVCVDAATRLADDGVRTRSSACRRGTASRTNPPSTGDSVLPAGVPVLSVEAATTFGWAR